MIIKNYYIKCKFIKSEIKNNNLSKFKEKIIFNFKE